MPKAARLARTSTVALLTGGALTLVTPTAARAQAWFYPSFQVPTTVDRDYTFGVVAAGGADFLFQWREQVTLGSQLSFEAGLADPRGRSNTKVFVGGQYARELLRETADQPLDILFTAGAGIAVGDGPDQLRVPVGVSVGHTFPLDGDISITPYVHPRASIDVITGQRPDGVDRAKVSLDFDLGGSLTLTQQLALRASVLISGNDIASDAGFGIALTYRPTGLRRP